MKHNILLCIDSFFDGGAEMFVVRLGNNLARSHEVHVLELNRFKSRNRRLLNLLDESIRVFQPDDAFPIKWLTILSQRTTRPFFARFIKRSIARLKSALVWTYLIKNGITVVHSNSWISDCFMSKLVKFTGARFIITLHGHYELMNDGTGNFKLHAARNIAAAHHVAYLSSKNLVPLEIKNPDSRKFHVILNGIQGSCGYQSKKQVGQIHFAIASRAIKQKGWEETIEAANRISSRTKERVFLHLFGDGDMLHHWKRKYSSLDNIVFHGFVLDVIDHLKGMDVCLLPSYYKAESMPFSVIEYLSLAKPVIASRMGCIQEMIQVNGACAGFLIDVNGEGIDQKQLEKHMLAYIEQPNLIEEHSKLSEKAFERFDIDNCAKQYLKVYSR